MPVTRDDGDGKRGQGRGRSRDRGRDRGRPGGEPQGWARRAAGGLAWWCVLYAAWFLFCGQVGWAVAAWGAVAAAVAVVPAWLLGGRVPRAGGPNVRRAARLPRIAGQTVLDFGIVTAVLARSMAGGRRGHRKRPGQAGRTGRVMRRDAGAARHETAAMADWHAMAGSVAPNSYVLAVDRDTGQALVHELRPRPPRRPASEEPV